MKNKAQSLYIHIPFCNKICPYCDFFKIIKNKKIEDAYIKRLILDIQNIKKEGYKFKTIYIGGGTPSCLDVNNLELLLIKINTLDLTELEEFTIEINPESIDEYKLKLFKKYKISRISIGIETFNKELLKYLNRDYEMDYFSLIELIKKYFKNINVDLMYGFKNQTLNDLKYDLINFIKLDVPHISIYSLIIEPNTIFYIKNEEVEDNDKNRLFYDNILLFLRNNGYKRYEVSNFSKLGYESKHNLTYWKNEEYVALGANASGYQNNIRYQNTKSINKYINGINEQEKEYIDLDLEKEYYLITNLRLEDGFNLLKYKELFNEDFYSTNKKIIDNFIEQGLLVIDNNQIKTTDSGMMLLDLILKELI